MNHGIAIPKARVFSESQRASYQRMTLGHFAKKDPVKYATNLLIVAHVLNNNKNNNGKALKI